jgi:gas vesicle protein
MSQHSNGSPTTGSSGGASSSWMLGLLLGLLGGTAIALLTAPKSGTELRAVLKKSATGVPDKLSEIVDDSLDLYASALNYCQLLMEDQTARIKRAVAAGKLAAAKKREELESGGQSLLPFQHR